MKCYMTRTNLDQFERRKNRTIQDQFIDYQSKISIASTADSYDPQFANKKKRTEFKKKKVDINH